jgi:formylmethanofuran dehydrogenase subunit E
MSTFLNTPNDPVKILECKVCGEDVIVNANYPITEVTCRKCYAKSKLT